jgi:hypothetical protein
LPSPIPRCFERLKNFAIKAVKWMHQGQKQNDSSDYSANFSIEKLKIGIL